MKKKDGVDTGVGRVWCSLLLCGPDGLEEPSNEGEHPAVHPECAFHVTFHELNLPG